MAFSNPDDAAVAVSLYTFMILAPTTNLNRKCDCGNNYIALIMSKIVFR